MVLVQAEGFRVEFSYLTSPYKPITGLLRAWGRIIIQQLATDRPGIRGGEGGLATYSLTDTDEATRLKFEPSPNSFQLGGFRN